MREYIRKGRLGANMTHITESQNRRNGVLSVMQLDVRRLSAELCEKAMGKKWITRALTEEVPWRTCQLGLLVGQQIDVGSLNVVSCRLAAAKVFHWFL